MATDAVLHLSLGKKYPCGFALCDTILIPTLICTGDTTEYRCSQPSHMFFYIIKSNLFQGSTSKSVFLESENAYS